MVSPSSNVRLPEPYRLRLVDTGGGDDEGVRQQIRAISLGFHMADPSEDVLEHYVRYSRGERLWAVQGPTPDPELPGLPVATLTSYTQTVNTGGGHLEPANYITDVTVRSTHRRRGLLRALMTNDLERAREEGLAMATLTATEGAIYGRFGYGVATHNRKVEVTSDGRFVLNHDPAGSIVLADPKAIDEERVAVFAAFHASHRGSHDRHEWHTDHASGRYDLNKGEPDRRIRSAIHRDPQGTTDGVVSYRIGEDFGSTLDVVDLVAANPNAELALWEFLASIDLVTTIRADKVNPATPLPWAVRDPRVVKFTSTADLTWLRILDVEKALSVRAWDHVGSVAVRVTDPLEWCEGVWRIDVEEVGGQATLSRLPEDAEAATLDISALGSLYFGTVRGDSLAAAGRLSGSADQVAAVHRMFSTVDMAHNISAF